MLNVTQNILLDGKYVRSANMVARAIAGEIVLVPLRSSTGQLDNIFSLNETAAAAWNLLDGQRSLRAVLAEILAGYEIGAAEAEQDLLELVATLLEIGAVEEVA